MENSSEHIEDLAEIIQRQTSYSFEESIEKLKEHNNNHIDVIKEYMGIKPKEVKVKSINQEIFKQIRHKLDNSMKEYNNKNQIDLQDVIDKLG
jgi:hypothetical protein